MKITTKAIYNLMVRFAIISVSTLVIASCNKENDTEEPTPDVASIEIVNFEDGDGITINETTSFVTFATSPSGNIENSKVTFTNVEDNQITYEFDLIGKMPKSINQPISATLSADVVIDQIGEYVVTATYEYTENGIESITLISSEEITIEASTMIGTE
ncbi:hypothetical protein EI427_11520 [Flammeovirga pectinis]|uniref:DUF4625 domain-containing protein n=1 Tax=Flammeovirga pectinis TaxID=2494373 RepID=A0A3Q9FRI2_9BACT|nr:hypothetical protein [Flammeovirga pectinis]AZQ62839.1 hypothetical protein EI427_11520 [Flammeovirga pectinis]